MNIINIDLKHKNNICHPVIHFFGNENIYLASQYDSSFYNNLYKVGYTNFVSLNTNKIIKTVNLNLKKYESFEHYINSISKNIKRDYFRALGGEKNRNYTDICYNTIINYYKNYVAEFDISACNNATTTIDCYNNNYKKKGASKSYPYYCLLDDLTTKYSSNEKFYILSRYIRIKLTFKMFDIYQYINDIEYIIKKNHAIKKSGNWKRYYDFINNIKCKKQNVNVTNSDNKHKIIWYGVFDFNKLVSFIQINYDGDLTNIGYFFSNPDYLKYSCVTFLLINVISELLDSNVKVLNYWGNNCKGQIDAFSWKQKFGFEESCLLIKQQ